MSETFPPCSVESRHPKFLNSPSLITCSIPPHNLVALPRPEQALKDDELIHRRLVELNVQEQCLKVTATLRSRSAPSVVIPTVVILGRLLRGGRRN